MLRFKKSLVLLLAAVIATASVPFTSFAGVNWAEKFAAEYNFAVENSASGRTDWARETADAPVVSIYSGTAENNIDGQFDMAGAIKAFEYAQAHRFPGNYGGTLKAYVWDDTLAGLAQKELLSEVTLGVYDRGAILDSTGRYDQTKVYGNEVYLIGTSGYPYDIRFSNTYRGKTVDEAVLSLGTEDGLRSPLHILRPVLNPCARNRIHPSMTRTAVRISCRMCLKPDCSFTCRKRSAIWHTA